MARATSNVRNTEAQAAQAAETTALAASASATTALNAVPANQFTDCTNVIASAAGSRVSQGLVATIRGIPQISISPVIQRWVPQQNGLRITGTWLANDTTDEGRFFFMTVRRPSSGDAHVHDGFGVAWRRSAATATTRTTANNNQGDRTLTVASTADFPDDGDLFLTVGGVVHQIAYIEKTNRTFTCATDLPATTSGQVVTGYDGDYNVYLSDGGNVAVGDNHLVNKVVYIRDETTYNFELLLSPPTATAVNADASAVELRLWEAGENAVRPGSPTLSYGSYIPLAVRSGHAGRTHFGMGAYDTDGLARWTVGNIKIDSIAPTRPHYLFRFDGVDFTESDLFRARVRGRAQGQDGNSQAWGMTLRAWHAQDSQWTTVATSTESTVMTLLSDPLDVGDYRDDEGYIWAMVSGDHPWGLSQEASMEVSDASIYDDGIQGLHLGGKADVYVRSYTATRSASADLSDVPALVSINDANGFSGPIARIDAIYRLTGSGLPTGTPLEEGSDWALTSVDRHSRYSEYENLTLSFAPDVQGADLRVFYQHFQHIGDIQRFFESPDQRSATADLRCRAFIPAFVATTVYASGYTITDDAMRRSLVDFVNALSNRLEVSDLIDEVYRLGATQVDTPWPYRSSSTASTARCATTPSPTSSP